jgi:hypothetical protein
MQLVTHFIGKTILARSLIATERYQAGTIPVLIFMSNQAVRKVAEAYAAIPRLEHLKHPITTQEMLTFKSSDPRFNCLAGVALNSEVGTPRDQLSLMMDVMGIECSQEQRVSICWMLEMIAQQIFIHADAIAPQVEAAMAGAKMDSFIFPGQPTKQ